MASSSTNGPYDPTVPPSGTGCVECMETDGWWLHLRRCARCGHVGCCDSSPAQHASKHAAASEHPVAQSFEPGEEWFWDYTTGEVHRRAAAGGSDPPPVRPTRTRSTRPGAR